MVTARPGRSTIGCIFVLLVLVAAGYFGVNAAEVYYRYYRFQDGFRQEARFAGRTSDDVILARLHALADSLDLPTEAHHIRVRRRPDSIDIGAEYSQRIELPLYVREVHFAPHAEAPL